MEPGRLSRIRRAMEEEGIDVLICRNPENVLYVSGYWPVTGWSLAVLPLDGEPTLNGYSPTYSIDSTTLTHRSV